MPLVVSALALSGCGVGVEEDSSSSLAPVYSVVTADGKMNEVDFASSFNEDQFVIENNNNEQVAKVTSAMVSGFDATQTKFSVPLTAKVSYQGASLDLTYVIKAHYYYDDVDVRLTDDQHVVITSVASISKMITYTIPEHVSALPAPANSWPVTGFEALAASDALTELHLTAR